MKYIFFLIILLIINSKSLKSQEIIEYHEISDIEETGQYNETLSKFKKFLEKDSLNANLWAAVGKLYRLNQQYKQSIIAYRKAIQMNPENKNLLLPLAKVTKLAGIKETAIALYKDFLNNQPNNVMALSDLAELYHLENKPDSAARYYKKLFYTDTLNVGYLCKWAYNQWAAGKQMESFTNYKKAYIIDSTYLPGIYDLARIYVKLKKADSSIIILKKNIEIYPEENSLYAEIGNAYFSKTEYFNTTPYYEKAINLGYKGNEAYKRLAISYYSLHEYEKSKLLFETLIKKDTGDYKICLYLGHIYNFTKEYQKAGLFLEKSLQLINPDPMVMATIYSGLDESYNNQGKYKEQIEVIQKRQDCLPVEYKSEKYLFEIAMIYEKKLMNKQLALQYYQDYYNEIKNQEWLSQDSKNDILAKINELRR